jgi:hypothetical protein
MGLIQLIGNVHLGTKQPELTPFGRIVFLEDPHLKERVTQWIAHLNLCGGLTGADAWHQIFFSSNQGLGMHFSRSKLEDYLSFVYGTTRKGIIGPIIRMYEDEASFRLCGALSTKKDMVVRRPAPIVEEFGLAYGAWILQLIVDYFPKVNQVTLTELDNKAGWKSIPGWNIEDAHRALDLIDRKGLIAVDRQMTPWIVHPRSTPIDTWKQIYRDLV